MNSTRPGFDPPRDRRCHRRVFMRGDLRVFGQTVDQFGRFPSMYYRFKFAVCALATREDVLDLYLKINAGGTPHTDEELNRVRELLRQEA